MQVTVYRSSIKEGLYVYVKSGTPVEDVPPAVMKQLGVPELALEFDLSDGKKLPNADAGDVVDAIQTQGFYIQMPADIETLLARLANQNVPTDR